MGEEMPPKNARPEWQTQQSITSELGEYKALRSCSPTCFYMLSRAAGYFGEGSESDLTSVVTGLDWENDFSRDHGWNRKTLADHFRSQYGMDIVTWRPGDNVSHDPNVVEQLRTEGYIHSDREADFFRSKVAGRNIAEVVAAGYQVVAGVLPGFGHNRTTHAVVLSSWSDGEVEVIDPDERNPHHTYSEEYVNQYLNPEGAGYTIILPYESASEVEVV